MFSRISFWKMFLAWSAGDGRVTATSSNQTQFLSSCGLKKILSDIGSFDSFRSKFFAKVNFMFWNHFYWMNMTCEFFPVFFWWKCLTSGATSWNTRNNCFWMIIENPYKILWGCRTCVGRVETVATNHLQRFLATGYGRVRNSRSPRWFCTDLRTRSWATVLSTAKYWTDPEKPYLLSATLRNPFGSHTAD